MIKVNQFEQSLIPYPGPPDSTPSENLDDLMVTLGGISGAREEAKDFFAMNNINTAMHWLAALRQRAGI